jgi:hypothetical protein
MTYDFVESERAFANFIDQFERGTLPKPIWTHGDRLAVGTWCLVNFPEEIAIRRVRTGISITIDPPVLPTRLTAGSFARGACNVGYRRILLVELSAGRGSERVSRIDRIVSDILSKPGNKSTLRDI